MVKMFEILKNDLKQMKTPFILLVFIALMALPSIYAGVNINGLWDPYNNTASLGIAIVDNDNTTLSKTTVNNIIASKSFNFTLETNDNAMKKLNDGTVYSVIVIPDGFSNSVNSIKTTDPYTSQISFITNDKLNPVTTRITEAGARTIVDSMNDQIVGTTGKTVSNKIVDTSTTAYGYTETAQTNLKKLPVNNTTAAPIKTTNNYLTLVNNKLSMLSSIDTGAVYNWFHNPLTMDSKHINIINKYGSAIAPFYVSISLWVGALLTLSVLSVRTRIKTTPRKTYFGKMLTFIVIAIGQAILMTITLTILGVQYTSTSTLMLTLTALSIMFMIIIYSMVSLFGNVGKFIAIILLVFQVSATGGIFPVEMQSIVFQIISTYLPITYAITVLRETIINTNNMILIYNLSIIALMTIGSIIISTLTKNIIQSGLDKIYNITKKSELFD
jgi:putative membrane protein